MCNITHPVTFKSTTLFARNFIPNIPRSHSFSPLVLLSDIRPRELILTVSLLSLDSPLQDWVIEIIYLHCDLAIRKTFCNLGILSKFLPYLISSYIHYNYKKINIYNINGCWMTVIQMLRRRNGRRTATEVALAFSRTHGACLWRCMGSLSSGQTHPQTSCGCYWVVRQWSKKSCSPQIRSNGLIGVSSNWWHARRTDTWVGLPTVQARLPIGHSIHSSNCGLGTT